MSRITFKISPYIGEILQKIAENEIVQISTPTGSGKSLAIPEALYQRRCKVFVAVPTVVATLNLYNTAKNLLKVKHIGYAADAKIHYDENSSLIYATYGHMINFLHRRILNAKRENPFAFCTHLILDEVHMGTAEMIMVFAYYLHYREKFEMMPRLIMMSATLSGMNLIKPYGIVNWPESDSIFASESRYETKYEETDVCFSQSNRIKIETIVKIILDYHDNCSIAAYGDILVFVAGELDIKQITEKLKRENLLVMNLMSSTEQEDLHYVNLEAPEGFRKVILSTNVAETSVTVEGVGIVIDSMEAKVAMTSASGAFLLKRDIISKSNAIQRAGRCARAPFPGRSFPYGGIVHRLVTQDTYENSRKFAPYLSNEMVRTPIYNHVLNIYSHGLKPTELELQTTPEKLDNADILLRRYKLLNEDFTVTPSGRFAVRCPLTVDMATVLYNVLQNFRPSKVSVDQQLSGIISIACVISSCDRGYLLKQSDEKHIKYQSSSALETMCLVLNDYLQTGKKIGNKMAMYKWCKNNMISAKEFYDLCRTIRLTLAMCGKSFQYQPFNFDSAMKVFYPLLIQIKSEYLMENVDGKNYNYVRNPEGKHTLNTFDGLITVNSSRRIYALLIKSFNENGISRHRVICWIYEQQEKSKASTKIAPKRRIIPQQEFIETVVESVHLSTISIPSAPVTLELMSDW